MNEIEYVDDDRAGSPEHGWSKSHGDTHPHPKKGRDRGRDGASMELKLGSPDATYTDYRNIPGLSFGETLRHIATTALRTEAERSLPLIIRCS